MIPIINQTAGIRLSEPLSAPPESRAAGPGALLEEELDFYRDYEWCLNPFPTIWETIQQLRAEIDRLHKPSAAWQVGEKMTNVFLFSGALLNAVDEYLRGTSLRLPKMIAGRSVGRGANWTAEKLGAVPRLPSQSTVRRWRENWQNGLDSFLAIFVAGEICDLKALAQAGNRLSSLLKDPLPSALQAEHIYFPSAFRKLDLTHCDILALGRQFVARFPDRSQPILLLGFADGRLLFRPPAPSRLQGRRVPDGRLDDHPSGQRARSPGTQGIGALRAPRSQGRCPRRLPLYGRHVLAGRPHRTTRGILARSRRGPDFSPTGDAELEQVVVLFRNVGAFAGATRLAQAAAARTAGR